MQNNDFIFFGFDEQGRSYIETAAGNIQTVANPTPLPEAPDGWEQQRQTWTRNLANFGVWRTITTPFTFRRTGAKILRHLFWTVAGVMSYIQIAIGRRNNDNQHEAYFVGNANFSTFHDQTDGVQIELNDGRLTEMVKANENTVYSIPVNVPEAVTIDWSGINLSGATRFFIGNGDQSGPQLYDSHIVGMEILSSEVDEAAFVVQDADRVKIPKTDPGISNGEIAATGQFFFKATNATSITLNANFSVKLFTPQVLLSITFNVVAVFLTGSDEAAPRQNLYSASGSSVFNATTGAANVSKIHDISINATFNVPAGASVYIIAFNTNSLQDETTEYDYSIGTENVALLSYSAIHPNTPVKGLPPEYVFKQLISKITEGKFTGRSNLLASTGARGLLSVSGDALRGKTDAEIKTSLADFCKSYNVPLNIMQGVETDWADPNNPKMEYIIESFDYAFPDDKIADIGEVDTPNFTPFSEYLYSSLRIGWPERTYNDLNGRQEPNTISVYTTPIAKEGQELEIVSIFRGDPIGAEYQRIRLTSKETTDAEGDNEVWIIDTVPTGPNTAILNRPAYTNVQGLISPETMFNLTITPAKCLRVHGSKIRGFMWPMDGGKLAFQVSDKNKDLSTTLDGVTITEKGDVLINTLEAARVIAVGCDVNANVPFSFNELMENPQGYIEFTAEDTIFKAYIVEASQQAADDAPQEFSLIMKAGNDFKKLVR